MVQRGSKGVSRGALDRGCPMNRPLRVVLWEVALGILLAAGVLGAVWLYIEMGGVS